MANPLTFEYRIGGVLTPVAPGPVTIGITRNSDSATILASGTATTNASAGVYTYDPTSLALSSSLAYTATWTYIDGSGSHSVADTIEAADGTRTLQAYRRNVQYRLGRFLVVPTTNIGTASELVIDQLVDSDGATTTYNGVYAYLASGALQGQERAVAGRGFTAATGTFGLNRSFGSVVASGVQVEIAHQLPATSMDGIEGVNASVNWALRRCWFRDRISFTPVAGQKFYSLQPWAHWLTRDLRIGQIYSQALDTLSNPTPWRGGCQLRHDGEIPMLEIGVPFSSTDTIFYLEVLRPGHTWIQSGGAWSESTAGLVSDSDQALVNPDLVTEMALVHALRQLSVSGELDDYGPWHAREQEQALKAARLRNAMLEGFTLGATRQQGLTIPARGASWGWNW